MAGRPFELGGVRWWPAAGAGQEPLRATLRAALDALAGGGARNLKRGRRKELYPLALAGGSEPSHLLKVNRYGARAGVRRRIFGSKARRELRLAERIAKRGVATPIPLAAGERREAGRVAACFLLIPFVAGARDLRRVAATSLAAAERRALARTFGAFARRVHDAGIEQDDFQPNNFLLGPGGPADLLLIDCERIRLRGALAGGARARQLAKLAREMPAASRAERARFLLAYAKGDRGDLRAWWRRIEREVPRLARHDAARLRRAVARRGRRFLPLELSGWRGVCGASLDAQELARALAPLLAHEAGRPPGAAELFAAGERFALGFAAPARGAALRALAIAVLLARRGLAPVPLAVLQRSDRALLLFDGPLPRRLDARASLDERRGLLPALALLLARLRALGELEPPSAELVGLGPRDAAGALLLLAPTLLRPRGRAAPGGRLADRALAARILALQDP